MIDFHCHLDLYTKPLDVARECAERGLYVLSVTNTPSAWDGTAALAQGAKRIQTGLGLHPQLVHERKGELNLFEQLLSRTRYVGEIGLDGAPEFRAHWDDQVEVFDRILELCTSSGGRLLSVHSRRAASSVLERLERNRLAGTAVLHWFSGTSAELSRAIDLGCWFSVGPAMLASEKGRKLVSRMPRSRIVTESDGPFAQINGSPVFPWDIQRAVIELANIWNVDVLASHSQIAENFRSLVGRTPTASLA